MISLESIEEIKKARILIAKRIDMLLLDGDFSLSPEYLAFIHEYLFRDIYSFAGIYRSNNIYKKEAILNGESVIYSNYQDIEALLNYDINEAKDYNFKSISQEMLIKKVAHFSSNLWQIHPFSNGNTRTIGVFIEKFLASIGFKVSNDFFKENSLYYRNAFVLSNYYNKELNIKPDYSYLNSFYKSVLNNNLELKRIR